MDELFTQGGSDFPDGGSPTAASQSPPRPTRGPGNPGGGGGWGGGGGAGGRTPPLRTRGGISKTTEVVGTEVAVRRGFPCFITNAALFIPNDS